MDDEPILICYEGSESARGLTGVRAFLEGSLSHEVATHAGRPVLIVPPPL